MRGIVNKYNEHNFKMALWNEILARGGDSQLSNQIKIHSFLRCGLRNLREYFTYTNLRDSC